MKTALVIGGGMAGCAAAHQFALAGGWDVTIVEAGSHLGAGVRTQWMGGHPYTFGPRHLLTRNEEVYAFLDKYVPLRRCNEHEFLTYVEQDQAFYNYPIHADDIEIMPERDQIRGELAEKVDPQKAQNFEDFWVASVGRTLYGKFVDTYSQKMWQVGLNTEIDDFMWSPKGVTIKEGPRAGWDTALSAYPLSINGYDDYFGIASQEATVLLNTTVGAGYIDKRSVVLNGEIRQFDIIVSTISPDQLFWRPIYGALPFMGRDITALVLPVEFALPPNVYFCYYAGKEKYTRVTEYKKLTQHKSGSTLITLEYPSKSNKLYPMPFKSEQDKAEQYFDMMPDGVFSIGRAGSYNYSVDIDDCIEQAMEMMHQVKAGGRDHPVPLHHRKPLTSFLLDERHKQ